MGWLWTLGVLTLLAVLPLGASVSYDEEGAVVRLILGPVRITLYPRPKKEKKPKDKQETAPVEKKSEKKTTSKQSRPEKKGGSITDFLPLVKIALDFLGDFRRKLRVNVLNLKLIMAADDPCDLSINYGRAWAAVGNLMPQLERFLTIKKRNIEVECDFTSSETRVLARLDLTITLGRLLAAVVVFAFRAVVQFIKIKMKQNTK